MCFESMTKAEYYKSIRSISQTLVCFKCGNRIKPRVKQIHVNIHNKPSIKFFCSKECKYQWIFKKHKGVD